MLTTTGKKTAQPFTVEMGLKIQKDHLKKWASVLSAEAYFHLLAKVDAENAKGYKSGYDVFRGVNLDAVVMNYANAKCA